MYPMKKIYFALAILSLAPVRVDATEQDSVNRCAAIIREFRQMRERAIPRDVLRHARGVAIMSVLKAGFIFSGKGGQGVVVARTPHGWPVRADGILSGEVRPPPGAAPLRRALSH